MTDDPLLLARHIERAACQFIHIPGPNPILTPGKAGAWDDGVIEACDAIKDLDTYYLYYHGTSARTGYQIGVATAPHPLGPWTKVRRKPVLPLGPEGSWDNSSVACAAILKEGVDRYTMWYSGRSEAQGVPWSIGLATADSPLGPWRKHPANPIIPDFGYVGGVVKVGGRYRLYAEHPIGSTGPDYGPMALATADSPEGPWQPHGGNPVLAQGEWGQWDDGGFSEAKVVYSSGLYHMFYGGAKLHPTRILSRESIGYAYSLDGVHFHKHVGNPVAPREANPDAAAFAEVHCLHEPPFWYLYHTLRYNSRDGAEDIGVQVLATQRPFKVTMPVLQVAALGPGRETTLEACRTVSLAAASTCVATVEAEFDGDDEYRALLLAAYTSHDGVHWDTEEQEYVGMTVECGEVTQKTWEVGMGAAFVKVRVENRHGSGTARGVRAWVTVGG